MPVADHEVSANGCVNCCARVSWDHPQREQPGCRWPKVDAQGTSAGFIVFYETHDSNVGAIGAESADKKFTQAP